MAPSTDATPTLVQAWILVPLPRTETMSESWCFDGKGHIVASSTAPHLSGGVNNTNGVVASHDDVTGTYKVTNSPGDGMGIFEGRCSTHAFVLRHIESDGLARGFSYILLNRKNGCKDNGPLVIGGSAEYQGPLK